MYRKLDNDTWEEYLNKFNSIKDTITVKDFCAENNLNKSQFINNFIDYVEREIKDALPRSPLGKALDYAKKHLPGLKNVLFRWFFGS
ncbi:hypothetical protein [Clostridium brassicae]|uniref:Uncharacterized protein n=1 Tax=Clostridium brassicae TaxID=2999072 RepID=A0ABT4D838_9CLOT|nr:hypothetical protein [Clostridium brassicae]MCY6958462.1 hypothetical protein [Clostridium brassicae]